jgi:hypothetical protein
MSLATVVTPRPNTRAVLFAKVAVPVPKALLLYTPMVPALTVVPPVKVLAPVNTNEPEPTLASVTPVPEITPVNMPLPVWLMVSARPLAKAKL